MTIKNLVMKKELIFSENISFRYQRQMILNRVSFTLYEKEIVALIGGNGTGKTTLLEILIGKKLPDSGQIKRSLNMGNFWLGYLPDKAPLYPDWRVDEFLVSCAKIRGITSPLEAVQKVITACQLQMVKNKKCSLLSHGYKQRVGLAQALIHQPKIVILDEPTNGLDTQQKLALRPLLSSLKESCSVLFTSHDWEEVLNIADRVYHLSAGILTEITLPPRSMPQIWAECENPQTAQVFQDTNIIIDGRFIGFPYDGSTEQKRALWQKLSRENAVLNLYSTYPRAAFQEKLQEA